MIARLIFNRYTLGAVAATWAWAKGGSALKNTFNKPAAGTEETVAPSEPPTALGEALHTADATATAIGNTVHKVVKGGAEILTDYAKDKDGTFSKAAKGTGQTSDTDENAKKDPSILERITGLFKKEGADGEDGEFSWMKLFGFGGGAIGLGMLLKKWIFGSDNKNGAENSSGIFTTLLTAAAVIGGAILVFKNMDWIKGKFHEVTGNRFNSDSPSVAQHLTSDPTGRTTNVAAFVPSTTPATPTAQKFAAAHDPEGAARGAISKAAGRPVRATIEGPPRDYTASVERDEPAPII